MSDRSATSATEVKLYRRVAAEAGLPFVRLGQDPAGDDAVIALDADAAVLLSETVSRHFVMLVLEVATDSATLAICEPSDDLALQAATALTGLTIQPVVAPRSELERAIDQLFNTVSWYTSHPTAPRGSRPTLPIPSLAPTLGAIMVAQGAVTDEQISAALVRQRQSGGRIGDVLLQAGVIDEATLVEAVAAQLQVPVVELSEVTPDVTALACLPTMLTRELRIVPLVIEGGALYVATSEPLTPETVVRVRAYTALQIRPLMATATAIDAVLAQLP